MKIEQITFTRFIAALSIVVFHYGQNIFPFNLSFIQFFFEHANVGVSYFFLLSGFVLIIANREKQKVAPMEFYLNRFARIYPVYLLAYLFMLFYEQIFLGKSDLTELYLHLFAVQTWVPGRALSFNYPAWSLSVELVFYLIFPLTFNFLYRRVKLRFLSFAIISIWIISQLAFHYYYYSGYYTGFPSKSHDVLYYMPLMHLSQFLLGNIAGLFFLKYRHKLQNSNSTVIFALVVLILVMLKNPFGMNYHNGLLSILFLPLLLLLSSSDGYLSRLFAKQKLVYLGEISYGLYILQVPIFSFSYDIFNIIGLSYEPLKFYISLILLVFTSFLSYRYFEVPMRRLIRSKLSPYFSQS